MSSNTNEENFTPVNKPFIDDEIDLFELWQNIWSQKALITIVTLLTGLFGTTYALIISPVYQSEAVIGKPQPHTINNLDLSSLVKLNGIQLTPDSIYRQFLESIDNSKVVKAFIDSEEFTQYYLELLSLSPSGAVDRFYEDLSVTLPSTDNELFVNESRTTLQFDTLDPALSQMALQQLLLISSDVTKKQITQNLYTALMKEKNALQKNYRLENQRLNDELTAKIEQLQEKDQVELTRLQHQINAVREKKLMQTQQRIERLEADLEIAESLGIISPVNPLDYRRQNGKQANVVNLLQNAPSNFWLGTETLQQKITNLKNRDNPDAFIDELPILLEKRKLLENNPEIEALKNRNDNHAFSEKLRALAHDIEKLDAALLQLDEAQFSVFRMIKQPNIPENPIKPNKKLIVVLSLMLGGMLGIFLALLTAAIKNRQDGQVQI
ncbi:MAG: Wzz/FepE/Etk N-terminal domain-containing protein [Methylophaga sp.]|nr:Wzz/FepE/Etk N-terminal domain-containing protein [Methylophaga sp.]